MFSYCLGTLLMYWLGLPRFLVLARHPSPESIVTRRNKVFDLSLLCGQFNSTTALVPLLVMPRPITATSCMFVMHDQVLATGATDPI
jgi:hypothetical protein